eukprot:GHVN01020415.1.p2 GENE.GHVN01020415.1~~GHVN01020415.1.p2  ORF type:complete len:112 (+),score=8.72 GHVN01020415.1:772-1107(+)
MAIFRHKMIRSALFETSRRNANLAGQIHKDTISIFCDHHTEPGNTDQEMEQVIDVFSRRWSTYRVVAIGSYCHFQDFLRLVGGTHSPYAGMLTVDKWKKGPRKEQAKEISC